MAVSETIKGMFLRKPAVAAESGDADPLRYRSPVERTGAAGSTANPYLNARRTWNEHIGALVAQRQAWQLIGILSLLIALAAVGGMVHIGSQSKFIPYIVQVDRLGQAVSVGPVQASAQADQRVVHAAVAEFINDARSVSPDVAMQRKAVFRLYARLAPNDPATAKMNEWLNGHAEASPFKRAEKEMVNVEIQSVLPQTSDTWQVDWQETTRDRQGTPRGQPVTMRAVVTVYVAETTPSTTDEQLRMNPLGIYVRDFSWSRLQ